VNSQHVFPFTKSATSKTTAMSVSLQQISHYVICAVLGVLGGGLSVALMISLTIILQLASPPTSPFEISITMFTLVTAIVSGGAAWLVGQAVYRLVLGRYSNLSHLGMQIILTFAVLTSLLQSLLFMRGL